MQADARVDWPPPAGAGVFTTDPVSGYPPGTPDLSTGYTTSGALHDLLSVPTFLGIPLAAFVFTVTFLRSGQRAWALYSALSGVVFLVAFVLASAAFAQRPGLVDFGGSSSGPQSSSASPG